MVGADGLEHRRLGCVSRTGRRGRMQPRAGGDVRRASRIVRPRPPVPTVGARVRADSGAPPRGPAPPGTARRRRPSPPPPRPRLRLRRERPRQSWRAFRDAVLALPVPERVVRATEVLAVRVHHRGQPSERLERLPHDQAEQRHQHQAQPRGRTTAWMEEDSEHRDGDPCPDAEDDGVHDRRSDGPPQPGDQAARGRERPEYGERGKEHHREPDDEEATQHQQRGEQQERQRQEGADRGEGGVPDARLGALPGEVLVRLRVHLLDLVRDLGPLLLLRLDDLLALLGVLLHLRCLTPGERLGLEEVGAVLLGHRTVRAAQGPRDPRAVEDRLVDL